MNLFDQQAKEETSRSTPLADRMRPKTLADFAGQEHLVGEGRVLRLAMEKDEWASMIFWGTPGVGKTTLARIIAQETKSDFVEVSAVTAGVADIRKILEKAKANRQLAKRTILFIDEIHRFNKGQQDALLHSVEDGTVHLIGATTENPSFEVNAPLLSRCRVYRLHELTFDEVAGIVKNALRADEILSGKKIEFLDGADKLLVNLAGGDARSALNALELTVQIAPKNKDGVITIDPGLVKEALQTRATPYDKKGDYHYDVISAFIKSVRGSDPNAALYWLARMVEAGEDPKFIARRLIILASEDIGNADPQALVVATAAFTAIRYIGMPEGRIVLAQATTYLASAAKSNASYKAISAAQKDVREKQLETVPLHLRNAPTKLMRQEGHGQGYLYPHDYPENFVEQAYLPEKLADRMYYQPTKNGAEAAIGTRLRKFWKKYRDKT